MKTLNEGWQGYVREVMPDGCSETQLIETRRAFFGGAWVALMLMGQSTAVGMTDEEAEAAFRGWLAEAMTFANSVGTANEGGRPQ
jgi:hypothetical protein